MILAAGLDSRGGVDNIACFIPRYIGLKVGLIEFPVYDRPM